MIGPRGGGPAAGGESIVALTRRTFNTDVSRSAVPVQPRAGAPAPIRRAHSVGPRASPLPLRPLSPVAISFFFSRSKAAFRRGWPESNPGRCARRYVAVRVGGAEIPAPPAPHTQGSGGSLEVGRRDDPQAAIGRLAWGERVANPAPLSNNNQKPRRYL